MPVPHQEETHFLEINFRPHFAFNRFHAIVATAFHPASLTDPVTIRAALNCPSPVLALSPAFVIRLRRLRFSASVFSASVLPASACAAVVGAAVVSPAGCFAFPPAHPPGALLSVPLPLPNSVSFSFLLLLVVRKTFILSAIC